MPRVKYVYVCMYVNMYRNSSDIRYQTSKTSKIEHHEMTSPARKEEEEEEEEGKEQPEVVLILICPPYCDSQPVKAI